MAHMTLPAAHSEADYLLAERIGRTLGLREVHVFWTLAPGERRPAAAPETTKRSDLPGGLMRALAVLWAHLGQRR
jgi:hypothetical protein